MSLTELLEPRDDDATTVAVYTATEEITRAELRARAEASGPVLRDAGLQPGQAVGVMLPNGPDVVAALFGVWYAGGVYVPLNPRLSDDEVAHVLAADRPAAIITATRRALSPSCGGARGGRSLAGDRPRSTADAPSHDPDIALIQFTSGTTGRPKPVLLRHSGVYSSCSTRC